MEKYNMQNASNQREADKEYLKEIVRIWENSDSSLIDKLRCFTNFVPYTEFPRLFVKYELFKKIIESHGAIVECGVHQGSGLMTWNLLSNIFEPVNHIRKIVGFDTFNGFPSYSQKDVLTDNDHLKEGGLKVSSKETIEQIIQNFDKVRSLGHINKIELIEGNAIETIPEYIEKNPHLIVSLLYLDFDLYEPTKMAINSFIERMPGGGIIVFDELYNKSWPGETLAVLDTLGIRNLKLQRFPFQPQISYAIL